MLLTLALAAACGTEAPAQSGNTAAPETEPVAPFSATQDPGTREITIVESSGPIPLQKWGEGEPYLPAPANYYVNYDWDTSPTTERPAFISDVVEHRSLSESVGIRGLSITTVAPRGGGESSQGFSTGFLWSSDPDDTLMGNPQPWPFKTAEDVSVVTGDLFTPYLVFQSHSAFEGTALVTAIIDYEQAERLLDSADGSVKAAILMQALKINKSEALKRLKTSGGFVRKALSGLHLPGEQKGVVD